MLLWKKKPWQSGIVVLHTTYQQAAETYILHPLIILGIGFLALCHTKIGLQHSIFFTQFQMNKIQQTFPVGKLPISFFVGMNAESIDNQFYFITGKFENSTI